MDNRIISLYDGDIEEALINHFDGSSDTFGVNLVEALQEEHYAVIAKNIIEGERIYEELTELIIHEFKDLMVDEIKVRFGK